VRGVNRRLVAGGFFGFGILPALIGGRRAFGQAAEGETIVVFGDSQGQGIAGGLQRVLLEDSRFRVINRTHPGAALVHGASEWLEPIRQFAARDHADIAVVMVGANDRLDLREDGLYLRFRSEEWRQAYAHRVDEMLETLRGAGLRVLWCGNPIARSGTYSADMEYLNQIYAEETARFGAQFLPLWDTVADGEGRYTAYGKDRDGITQRLRNDDGIHFTSAGYALIADKIVAGLPENRVLTAAPARATQ
jgi:uncharacterized protein